jgi:HlyD family secretion protein
MAGDLMMSVSRNHRCFLLATAALVAVLALPPDRTPAAEPPAAGGKPRVFRTAKVTRGDMTLTVNAVGTLEPEAVVNVGAPVPGTICNIRADYGSEVKAGEVIAEIDSTLYAAQYEQAKVGCQRAKAETVLANAKLGLAKVELQRAEELSKKNAITPTDLDAARYTCEAAQSNLALAEADIAQSQIALRLAQLNLDGTHIRSPLNGVIIDRRVNVGEMTTAALSAPGMFVIAKDLKQLQVWVSVNEADIGRIRKGQPARFTVDAYPAKAFEGSVSQIRLNATMLQNAVTYTVVVPVENPKGDLLPYMTANVQFEIARRKDALLAPNAALHWRPEWRTDYPALKADKRKKFGLVFVRNGDSVRPISVEVGETDGTKTEILGGDLQEGAEVVIGEVFATSDSRPPPAAGRSVASQLAASMLISAESKKAIERTMASMGVNQLLVMPGLGSGGGVTFGAGSTSTLTPADADAIVRDCPAVIGATPVIRGRGQIVYGGQNWVTDSVLGTSASYLSVRGWDLSEGAAFSDADVRNASKVCMIGETLKRELFRGDTPVGKELRIDNVAFRVVGVLGRKGANIMGRDQDDIVLAPWTTIHGRLRSPQAAAEAPHPLRAVAVDSILCQAASEAQMPQAADEITQLLRDRHRIRPGEDNDFSIRDLSEIAKAMMPWKR